MASEGTFLGVTRTQQLLGITVVGIVLVVAGLLSSSAVDPNYDPLLFGIGLVTLAYGVLALGWDAVRSLRTG